MGVERLILKGTKGLAEGETFYINYGEAITIGRAHDCDISYHKFKKYPTEVKPSEKGTLAVSRKHLRISFYNTHSVELKDLSSNGTYLNGKPINKRIFIIHVADSGTSYEIKLGPIETFMLSAETT
jgi:pSer/pThr/pTyr-binding forkhead associated (FHA) protein